MFNRDDPNTWPCFRPLIIAHDVGHRRDRSTAVVGGLGPFEPRLTGIKEAEELPQGLYGSARASALAIVDRRYHSDAIIVADLSNDATYAEVLFDTTCLTGRRSAAMPSPCRLICIPITREGPNVSNSTSAYVGSLLRSATMIASEW